MSSSVLLALSVLIALCALILTVRPYEIPRIIWCHWNSEASIPLSVRAILAQRRAVHPDWEIRLVTDATITDWLPAPTVDLSKLRPEHRSDWLRLALLERYGGVWMDASIVTNQSITPIWDAATAAQADYCGFWIEATTTRPEFPVIENWFIMVPRGSRVLRRWRIEFEHVLQIGFPAYKKELVTRGIDCQRIYNAEDPDDVYLTQHAAMQAVLQCSPDRDANFLLMLAEDTMFRIHSECNWQSECMREAFHDKARVDAIPYIKLRGGDRALYPTR
jgi:hypothetical protein